MTRYTEGFSHFATSMTAPITSGRSDSCAKSVGSDFFNSLGYKQTFSRPKSTSAVPPKADVRSGLARGPEVTQLGNSCHLD